MRICDAQVRRKKEIKKIEEHIPWIHDFHGFFNYGSESESESESESDDSECLVECKNNFSSVEVEAFNAESDPCHTLGSNAS